MSRYTILKRQSLTKPVMYHFKSSSSIGTMCGYLKKCIREKASFDASNMPSAILDPALMKICGEYSVPLVTESEETARIFSILYQNQAKVYSAKNLPPTLNQVVCYWDVKEKPKNAIPILMVVKNV